MAIEATKKEPIENEEDTNIFKDDEKEEAWINLEYLHDIPLPVIVELGQTQLTLGSLLKLEVGSTIELNKLAGEPLEFNLGGVLAARGEVVVINEKFGIRLTDVISPEGEDKANLSPG